MVLDYNLLVKLCEEAIPAMKTGRGEKIRAVVVLILGITEHLGLLALWRLLSLERQVGDMNIMPLIAYAMVSTIACSLLAACMFALLLKPKMGDVSERRLWIGTTMLVAPWASVCLGITMEIPLMSLGFPGWLVASPITLPLFLISPWVYTLTVYAAAYAVAHRFVTSRLSAW